MTGETHTQRDRDGTETGDMETEKKRCKRQTGLNHRDSETKMGEPETGRPREGEIQRRDTRTARHRDRGDMETRQGDTEKRRAAKDRLD